MPDLVYGNNKFMITDAGGYAIKLTNKTGSASVKGELVAPSAAVDESFIQCTADDYDPIGAVYDDGIADGSTCWVVIGGVAEVLLMDQTAATRGNWVRLSETEAGRADITAAAPSGGTIGEIDAHTRELGHCIESVAAGGAGVKVLAKIVMHFL
jgi:hypothetical protein